MQEKTIEYFKKEGDRHFTNDGGGAEMTIDLVLQARAKMSENKVNRPEGQRASVGPSPLPCHLFLMKAIVGGWERRREREEGVREREGGRKSAALAPLAKQSCVRW